MRRLLIITLAAACGGTPKPAPTAPLPPDETKQAAKPPAPPAREAQGGVGSSHAPVGHHRPPDPVGPIELKTPAVQTTVKLVSPGKGKKQALKYSATAGATQPVEVALDFTATQGPEHQVVPTIVLTGEAEAKTVGKDGSTEFAFKVTGTDALDNHPSIPVNEFKRALTPLVGLTVAGSHSANGQGGEVTLHHDAAPRSSTQTLGLVQISFPVLPVLPAQPVGVGAKWQSTTNARFADKVEVTQVTDYELVAHEGKTWTIKGTTKITGKDQDLESAKISEISGSGTSETTITEGALFPAHKASTETQFKASDRDRSDQVAFKIGSTITPK